MKTVDFLAELVNTGCYKTEADMDRAFLLGRIDATKLQIIAYENAAIALSSGVQSYTLDTGQDRQTVTRADIRSIQLNIDQLYNRLTMLQARLCGGHVVIAGPDW